MNYNGAQNLLETSVQKYWDEIIFKCSDSSSELLHYIVIKLGTLWQFKSYHPNKGYLQQFSQNLINLSFIGFVFSTSFRIISHHFEID